MIAVYEHFFDLRERPFDLTPNPRYLYLTASHREALSTLQYGVTGRRGLTLLIGEAGTGKTTLVRAALEAMSARDVLCVYISNPSVTRSEFYELLGARFELSADVRYSKAAFLIELERLVLARHEAGGVTALIVDEAQSLPPALLEEVRLLANIETATEKLLPVVLAGQPELAQRLDEPEFRQLKQRVALRCYLAALTVQETAAYIAGRIRIAGGDCTRIFTREAVLAIHEHSHGIPRTISVICDNALVTAFAADVRPVDSSVVLEVCRDFGLTSSNGASGNGEAAVVPAPEPRDGAVSSRPRLTLAPSPVPVAKPHGGLASGASVAGVERPAHAPARTSGLFSHFAKRRRFLFFWDRQDTAR